MRELAPIFDFLEPVLLDEFSYTPKTLRAVKTQSVRWSILDALEWCLTGAMSDAFVETNGEGVPEIFLNPLRFPRRRTRRIVLKFFSGAHLSDDDTEYLAGLVATLIHESIHLYQDDAVRDVFGPDNEFDWRGNRFWSEGGATCHTFYLLGKLWEKNTAPETRLLIREAVIQSLDDTFDEDDKEWVPLVYSLLPPDLFRKGMLGIAAQQISEKEIFSPLAWLQDKLSPEEPYGIGAKLLIDYGRKNGLTLKDILKNPCLASALNCYY